MGWGKKKVRQAFVLQINNLSNVPSGTLFVTWRRGRKLAGTTKRALAIGNVVTWDVCNDLCLQTISCFTGNLHVCVDNECE